MVIRVYFCKNCDHEFETVQPMHEKLKKKCPNCKKNKLVQDLSGGFYGSVKQYNTVGSIAERNTKELGTYGREDREKAVLDRDKSMLEERNRKLEERGYKTKLDKKSEFDIPQLPTKIKKKMASGDKKAVTKYILEGE